MGDFNLPGRLPSRLTGWRPLATGPTFPAPAPRLQLDHLLAEGIQPGVLGDCEIVHLPLSDHRALVVDLDEAALSSRPESPYPPVRDAPVRNVTGEPAG